MPIDLKCPNKSRHALLFPEEGVVEFKCDRSNCGARKGTIVLHRFDIHTGDLRETLKFADPTQERRVQHG